MEKKSYLFNVVFAGDSETGKSSIFMRYLKGDIAWEMLDTIEAEFWKKMERIDDWDVTLQIWDQTYSKRFYSKLKLNFLSFKIRIFNIGCLIYTLVLKNQMVI